MDLRFLLSSVVWNTPYEDAPGGDDSPSHGDDAIREAKEAIRERFEKEHTMNLASGTVAADGWHRNGSSKVYYQAAEPTTRPDSATALTVADNGRLWVRSTDNRQYVYIHPSWVLQTATTGGENTWTGINIFSTALRIPTSAPAVLADGDIWLE